MLYGKRKLSITPLVKKKKKKKKERAAIDGAVYIYRIMCNV